MDTNERKRSLWHAISMTELMHIPGMHVRHEGVHIILA